MTTAYIIGLIVAASILVLAAAIWRAPRAQVAVPPSAPVPSAPPPPPSEAAIPGPVERMATALDVMVSQNDKIIQLQKRFLAATMGMDANGLEVLDEHDASIRESAEDLVRRYKIPWEDALMRAKSAAQYRRS